MPSPSLPPGFDFTDPDLNRERLPVEELAELRRTAPIWWNEQPIDSGFYDGGYWVVTKHKDVKEISIRSDVFSSLEKTALPRFPEGSTPEQFDIGKFVLLNMDAPHHTHLRKIISRGFTPRAVERLRADLNERAQNIAKAAAAEGSGDFVEQVSCELPLQAIAGLIGIPLEDRKKTLRLVQSDGQRRRPGVRPLRRPQLPPIELIMYAMQLAAIRADGARRGHRHQADRGRRRRPQALRRRVRVLHGAARGGG